MQCKCLWWCLYHHRNCRSLSSSFGECRLSAIWQPTLGPSRL